jgi:hypothetical protein
MRAISSAMALSIAWTATAAAAEQFKEYTGPFPTKALYALCSDKSPAAREKCSFYLQGLMYGIKTQRGMHERDVPVCLPDLSIEAARQRILGFIDTTTGGKPASQWGWRRLGRLCRPGLR